MRKFEFYGSYIDYNILTLSTALTTRQRIRIISRNTIGVVEKIYIDWGDETGWISYSGGIYADHYYENPYSGNIRVRTESNNINNIFYIRVEDDFSQWNFDLSVLHNLSKLNVLILGWAQLPYTWIGSSKVTGSIDGFVSEFEQFLLHSENLITGDLAKIKIAMTPTNISSLSLAGSNMQLTYSTRTWPTIPGNNGIYSHFKLNPALNILSQEDIDQLLVDLSLTSALGIGSQIIYINGNNSSPSTIGLDAIAVLQSKGFTIIYNT